MERNNKGQFIKGHKDLVPAISRKIAGLKISKAMKGKCHRKNYQHSEETKEKIKQAHLDKGLSWDKKCKVCEKTFRVSKSTSSAQFCSCECRAQVIMPPRPDRTGCEPWNKGLTKNTDNRIKELAEDRMLEGNPNWKGNDIKTNSGNQRAQRMYPPEPCGECNKPKGVRHHIDGDVKNNELSNIKFLCQSCHMKLHWREGTFNNRTV